MNIGFPKSSIAILILSAIWILGSTIVLQNPVNLVLALGLGMVGIYFSYDQWFKHKSDERYDEHEKMLDSFLQFKMEFDNGKKK